MPFLTGREAVLEQYAAAAERGWVLPAFNTENQTGLEAILAAAARYAEQIDYPNMPIIIGLTNRYWHRPQSEYYSCLRDWKSGLRLFLDDVQALCTEDGPFSQLSVMVHMDHIQWDADSELLSWDLKNLFSSIMYDASTLPFEENIQKTAEFVKKHGSSIVIEGACDEIAEGSEAGSADLTTPEMAERFVNETGVDIIVANLGTEHRASAETLQYHGDLARQIKARIGTKICLHGTSSVTPEQVAKLFEDGICKVNIWTALERDSVPALFEDMVKNAAKIVGPEKVQELIQSGLLGGNVDKNSKPAVSHFSTTYRQDIIFRNMQEIVSEYLELWYTR